MKLISIGNRPFAIRQFVLIRFSIVDVQKRQYIIKKILIAIWYKRNLHVFIAFA